MFDTLILDEIHKIKNPKAKVYKAAIKLKGENRIGLSGTPLANNCQDLWAPMNFLRPGELGSFWSFKDRYTICDFFGSVVSYKNLNELKQKLHRVMIRRTKEEVHKELPPKLYTDIFCNLNGVEQRHYAMIRDEMIAEILNKKTSIDNSLVKMIRLKQLTCSLELLSGEKYSSSKLNTLQELLPNIIVNGNKAIIFTQFEKFTRILERELFNYNPLIVSGKIKNKDRQPIIDKFNNDDKYKIIIATAAAEHGLNIQRANIVINMDLPWSLTSMVQRVGRSHRIGQEKNVTIFSILAKNTIDQYIQSVIYKKKQMSNFLIDDQDELETEKLTKDDILSLLK